MKLNSEIIKDTTSKLMEMFTDLIDDATNHKDETISKSANLFPPMVFALLTLAGYYAKLEDEGKEEKDENKKEKIFN